MMKSADVIQGLRLDLGVNVCIKGGENENLSLSRFCGYLRETKEPPEKPTSSPLGGRSGGLIGAAHAIGSAKHLMANIRLALGLAAMITPTWAETADDLAKQYKKETMEQALQTKERFRLYGLRFESRPVDNPGRREIASRRHRDHPEEISQNRHLRIVGHTDATGEPQPNENLWLALANAIKAALIERGIATPGRGWRW